MTSATDPRREGHRDNAIRAAAATLSAKPPTQGTGHRTLAEPTPLDRYGVGPLDKSRSSGVPSVTTGAGTLERQWREPGAVAQPNDKAALGSRTRGHPQPSNQRRFACPCQGLGRMGLSETRGWNGTLTVGVTTDRVGVDA